MGSTSAGGVRRAPVETDCPADCPPVRADREAIEEALVNLLTNAAKYGPEGSPIRVTVACRGDRVSIAVSDRGIGIPPADVERIFAGFYRGEQARERNIPGLGIGLALARKVARAHGGDLVVASTPGAGSTFTLTLRPAGQEPARKEAAWTPS